MIINDGSASYDHKRIRASHPLSARVTRYSHSSLPGVDEISVAEMNSAADDPQKCMERLYPAQLPIEVRRDEDVTWNAPFPDYSGPWSEVATWLTLNMMTGEGRTIGLVDVGWFDRQIYQIFPDGRTGSSLGKLAPYFAIAEIGSRRGSTPAHELCHTFGLSGEPCDGDFIAALWDCEDEYNIGDFPDGPFLGSGYDFFGDPPGPVSGRCIMDGVDPPWISVNDYAALLEALDGHPDPRVLIVKGYVDALGSGRLETACGLAEGTPDRITREASPFAVVVLDDSRTAVGEYGILSNMPDGVFADNDGPDGIPGAIPWPRNGVAVELRGPSGAVIAGLPVEAVPPE